MTIYKDSNGVEITATQFIGYGGMGSEGIFLLASWVEDADLTAKWSPEVVGEAEIIDAEHLEIGEHKVEIDDYLIKLDGAFDVMPKADFEAIYKPDHSCKHCGKPIIEIVLNGGELVYWAHTEGHQRGQAECWPEDSGQDYGVEAEPVA